MSDDADFTDEQLLFTVVQAAHVLGVGRTTVYGLMKTGELHAVHIGRSCRISRAELVRCVARLDAANHAAASSRSATRQRRTTHPPGQRSLFAIDTTDPHDAA